MGRSANVLTRSKVWAYEHQPQVLGMSALLTTSMLGMEDMIQEIKKIETWAGPRPAPTINSPLRHQFHQAHWEFL